VLNLDLVVRGSFVGDISQKVDRLIANIEGEKANVSPGFNDRL
jgi:hypothetical protein